MTYIMIDIEADGAIPGDCSMVSFGAVIVEPDLKRTFYRKRAPIAKKWVPAGLNVSGFRCEQTLRRLYCT